MNLRYLPGQLAVRHAGEDTPLGERLGGLPVVCCSLHSQVAPVCAGLGPGRRVAYVQVPGGSLPVSLSDSVRVLVERGFLATTVAAGACVDGDVACVSVASALLWAVAKGMDAVVCAIGPGIVGTGSSFGHGGVVVADVANVAVALEGVPIVAVRASEADPRERHRGVSHHTRDALELCLGEVVVPWPAGWEAPPWLGAYEEVEIGGWADHCAELPLSHMGRSVEEDPLFFAVAFAAGRAAANRIALWRRGGPGRGSGSARGKRFAAPLCRARAGG